MGNGFTVETATYRLELARDGLTATLCSPSGDHWATLRPLAAFDTSTGRDETLAVAEPHVLDDCGRSFVVERRSTLWDRAATTIACTDTGIELRASVVGHGDLADVVLLGWRSLVEGRPSGFLPSGSSFRTLFSAGPADPGRILQRASEPAVIGVSGNDEPGRGHWFFTPAPLYFALATGELDQAGDDADWVGLSLTAPVEELTFVQLAYEPADRAFSLRLEYEGHTSVNGEHQAPTVVLTPGLADPYHGISVHRDLAVARGHAPRPPRRARPPWWTEPIFCGWGAQCHLARVDGRPPRDYATQDHYDAFLGELEEHDVVPGTVVIDDKWQAEYGTCMPDKGKWPDLRAWIERRHARGQRVLLWWKAWDAEGLPVDSCIRAPDGRPVAFDPTSPAALEALRATVAGMLAADGLDADGLKVDFTARTPSGTTLATTGPGWGIALLHLLLRTVYEAAKAAKPEALVITHTPHQAFSDVTDMIRLNDMLRLKDRGPAPDVAAQMRHRAAIIRAACADALVDTDDWCAPDLASWRAFLDLKPELGVPALYYVSHLDRTGERLEADDYDALRRTWRRWRAMQGEAGRR